MPIYGRLFVSGIVIFIVNNNDAVVPLATICHYRCLRLIFVSQPYESYDVAPVYVLKKIESESFQRVINSCLVEPSRKLTSANERHRGILWQTFLIKIRLSLNLASFLTRPSFYSSIVGMKAMNLNLCTAISIDSSTSISL